MAFDPDEDAFPTWLIAVIVIVAGVVALLATIGVGVVVWKFIFHA